MMQIEHKKPQYLKDMEKLRDDICEDLKYLDCIIRSKNHGTPETPIKIQSTD